MTAPFLVIAVEDELSGAVIEKLVSFSGYSGSNRIFNARGYGQLKKMVPTFRKASRTIPHIVLTDLDRSSCAPALLVDWGAIRLPRNLLFRVAIREVEAWLLADRIGISDFLNIDVNKVPYHPETEDDPKRTLINLARKSRTRKLAKEIAPSSKSSATIGILYNYHLINFVNSRWGINQARQNAPSLDRALSRIALFLSD
ncbi:MAG: DUF4276 family protein [Proteobacteria bacterium]|nr:DUF4276 family protein [Pseudomonadota bacterium]